MSAATCQVSGIKKPHSAVDDILITTLFYLDHFQWCPGRELNPHSHKPRDFKNLALPFLINKSMAFNDLKMNMAVYICATLVFAAIKTDYFFTR